MNDRMCTAIVCVSIAMTSTTVNVTALVMSMPVKSYPTL